MSILDEFTVDQVWKMIALMWNFVAFISLALVAAMIVLFFTAWCCTQVIRVFRRMNQSSREVEYEGAGR